MAKHNNKKSGKSVSIIVFLIVALGFGYNQLGGNIPMIDNILSTIGLSEKKVFVETDNLTVTSEDIPEYTGTKNIILNNNKSNLKDNDFYHVNVPLLELSDLDNLNRVGVARAILTPSNYQGSANRKEESSIGHIKPTGWKQKKVGTTYMYSRSHLIGYALFKDSEIDSWKNLMTGTRDFNANTDWGMLKYEYMVQGSIKNGKTVYYEINPVFEGDNLLAKGVQMRAWATDNSLDFNVFIYNVQDGMTIDYTTGAMTKN